MSCSGQDARTGGFPPIRCLTGGGIGNSCHRPTNPADSCCCSATAALPGLLRYDRGCTGLQIPQRSPPPSGLESRPLGFLQMFFQPGCYRLGEFSCAECPSEIRGRFAVADCAQEGQAQGVTEVGAIDVIEQHPECE